MKHKSGVAVAFALVAALVCGVLAACSGGGTTKIEAGDYTGSVRIDGHPLELQVMGFGGSGVETIDHWGVDQVADTGADTTGDVDAALWIGLPGLYGNYGVAQVLSGEVSPSGRLADTWAYEVESAPSYYNFGDFTYTNGGDDSYANKYVHYLEGIYVGYRWYETANAEGVSVSGVTNYVGESKDFDFSDYDSIVQYPFGYGLSYTTFS